MTHETTAVVDAARTAINAGHGLTEAIFECLPAARRQEWQDHTLAGTDMVLVIRWSIGKRVQAHVALMGEPDQPPQIVYQRAFEPLTMQPQDPVAFQ